MSKDVKKDINGEGTFGWVAVVIVVIALIIRAANIGVSGWLIGKHATWADRGDFGSMFGLANGAGIRAVPSSMEWPGIRCLSSVLRPLADPK